MAVREGLTRFARPAGSLFATRSGCPTGYRQLSNPRSRVLIPPAGVLHAKKKPAFSCELFFKYGGEGGIDSLRSPCGQPTHCVHGLSNWLSPVVEPSVEGSHPSRRCAICEKKPAFSCELFFKYGGEGGMDSLRSPCGQPVRCALRLSNWLSPVVEPSVEGSHPSLSGEYKRKKPVLSYELLS